MSSTTLGLEDTLLAYLRNHSLREPEVLKQLREETLKLPLGVMQVSPEQGQFMALLVRITGATPHCGDRNFHRLQFPCDGSRSS